MEGYEACDDGNSDSDDACLTDCTAARCGDGIHRRDLNPAHPEFEECDDGNDSDEDECSTTCISLGCGNGRLNEGEECDDGNIEDADGCRNDCTNAVCGDGVQRRDLQNGEDGFEACDDGNEEDGDDCTNGCVIATCGDGVLRTNVEEGAEGYEACDDGNRVDEDECLNACTIARCGDGVVRAGLEEGAEGFEACDDGNEADNDACRNSCIEAACGDGVIRMDIAEGQEGFESCDDGNQVNTDACLDSCASAVCGDGVQRDDIAEGQEGYEACDDGNNNNRDACVQNCVVASCGDGFVQRGEEVCDDGNNDDGDACDGDCQGPAPAFCEPPEGGGSEEQGYQFQWDTCQIGPAYAWPALQNPTAIRYTDDSVSGPHPIGFTFTFYGQEYTQFYTTSNGTFHFTRVTNSECCSGSQIPTAGLVGPAIAAFWGDINAPNATFKTVGDPGSRQMIYQRNGVEFGQAGNPQIYRVILSEGSNEITIMYQDAIYTNRNMSIGIQSAQNTRGLGVVYQTRGQVTRLRQKALRFVPW